MADKFKTEGAAAIMHAIMMGSGDGDEIMIAAATPEKLKRAFDDLVGGKWSAKDVSRVAICDADMAALMQLPGASA